jgi:hypothetical protein
MNITKDYLRDIFIGSITEETGGENCYNSMTLHFKVIINIIFVKIYRLKFRLLVI